MMSRKKSSLWHSFSHRLLQFLSDAPSERHARISFRASQVRPPALARHPPAKGRQRLFSNLKGVVPELFLSFDFLNSPSVVASASDESGAGLSFDAIASYVASGSVSAEASRLSFSASVGAAAGRRSSGAAGTVPFFACFLLSLIAFEISAIRLK